MSKLRLRSAVRSRGMASVTQLVTALQQELAQLEAELKADHRYRKATRIRELLADYVDQVQPQEFSAKTQTVSTQTSTSLTLRETGPRLSKKALIKNEIEQLLISEGPTHRKKILETSTIKGSRWATRRIRCKLWQLPCPVFLIISSTMGQAFGASESLCRCETGSLHLRRRHRP